MRCWPSYLLWFVIAVLGTGNLLSACGQRGDLYLPDETEEEKNKKPSQS